MPTKYEIEKRIATFGDPKSNGAWAKFVRENKEAEKKDAHLKKLIKHGVEHSSTPVSKAPAGSKKQKIDVLTYIEKMRDMYEGDNIKLKEPIYPSKANPRQIGLLAERLEESRQMTGEMSTWDSMKATAKTPAEKKEIRDVIRADYNKHGAKDMAQDDLKWIGKAKSQNLINDIKIDVSGISNSINNYINATKRNELVAPEPKKKDPDLDLGLAALLGVDYDN